MDFKIDPSINPKDFSGKTIFLTGGTGYIGKLFLRTLKTLPCEVLVLSRNPAGFLENHPELNFSGLKFLKGDIQNFQIPENTKMDFVLHGATPSHAPKTGEEALEAWNSSFLGTKHLIRQLLIRNQREQTLPSHFVYLSSGAVYGNQPASLDKIPEDYTRTLSANPSPLPEETYGEAKLATEKWLDRVSTQSPLSISVARIFACGGAYIPFQGRFALGQFIAGALQTGTITLTGTGSAVRSYLYGDELVSWLLQLLVHPEKSGTYNIGSEEEMTILETAETVKAAFGEFGIETRVEKKATGFEGPATAGNRYIPNTAKFTKVFGVKPLYSSRDAIKATVHWALKKNGKI